MEVITTFLPPKRRTYEPPLNHWHTDKPLKPSYKVTKYQQFSVPLTEILHNYQKDIPPVIRQAMKLIASNPRLAKQEYIFQRSAPQARLLILREEANKGLHPNFQDAYEASGIIKLFLREMVEPLIPSYDYKRILEFPTEVHPEIQLRVATEIIETLPRENKSILWRLFKLLEQISKFEDINHMGSRQLGYMIGPVICWADDSKYMKGEHMIALGNFATFLVEHAGSFFRYDPQRIPDGAWHSTVINQRELDEEEGVMEHEDHDKHEPEEGPEKYEHGKHESEDHGHRGHGPGTHGHEKHESEEHEHGEHRPEKHANGKHEPENRGHGKHGPEDHEHGEPKPEEHHLEEHEPDEDEPAHRNVSKIEQSIRNTVYNVLMHGKGFFNSAKHWRRHPK